MAGTSEDSPLTFQNSSRITATYPAFLNILVEAPKPAWRRVSALMARWKMVKPRYDMGQTNSSQDLPEADDADPEVAQDDEENSAAAQVNHQDTSEGGHVSDIEDDEAAISSQLVSEIQREQSSDAYREATGVKRKRRRREAQKPGSEFIHFHNALSKSTTPPEVIIQQSTSTVSTPRVKRNAQKLAKQAALAQALMSPDSPSASGIYRDAQEPQLSALSSPASTSRDSALKVGSQSHVDHFDRFDGHLVWVNELAAAPESNNHGFTAINEGDFPAKNPNKRSRKSFEFQTPGSSTGSLLYGTENEKTPRSGPFTEYEIQKLRNHFDRYREAHGLTERELNDRIAQTCAGGPSKSTFWSEICEVLPHREKQAVYKVCRRRFHNFEKRGKWTQEDDDRLKWAYEQRPNRWKEIGEMIERMAEDCRDRYRNYHKAAFRNSDRWTQEEIRKLRAAVNECMQAMLRVDGSGNESLINWQMVSEKMGGIRSRIQCSYKWKKLMEDESGGSQQSSSRASSEFRTPTRAPSWRERKAMEEVRKMLPGDKWDLLQAIMHSEARNEEEIDWQYIGTKTFRSRWSRPHRIQAFQEMKEHIPDHERKDLDDLLKELTLYMVEAYGPEAVVTQYYDPKAGDDSPEPDQSRRKKKGQPRSSQLSEMYVPTND